MTKKEIAEIRKQCKKEDSSFTRLSGCFVHGEDRQMDTFTTAFARLSTEDGEKYAGIFKKTLSGSINRNLFNVPFGVHGNDGVREALDKLVRSGLKDKEALGTVFAAVVDTYAYGGNYAVLLVHNSYDVPGRASDGTEMEDMSEEVYSYINCAICPVTLSKPGLAFQDGADGDGEPGFTSLEQDLVAGMPVAGFLYPAFNDRSADTSEALYYSADAKDLQDSLAEALFGGTLPMPADQQKECFTGIIETVLDGPAGYDTACEVKDCLDELLAAAVEAGEDGQAGMLDAGKAKAIAEGAAGRTVSSAEFEEAARQAGWEDGTLYAGNLTDAGQFTIKAPGLLVRVSEDGNRPELKKVDGRNCIVIPISGEIDVNGIAVQP